MRTAAVVPVRRQPGRSSRTAHLRRAGWIRMTKAWIPDALPVWHFPHLWSGRQLPPGTKSRPTT